MPIRLEVARWPVQFPGRSGNGDPDLGADPSESSEVFEIEVIGAEIVVGVDADDRVEESVRERQVVCLGVDRETRAVSPAAWMRLQLPAASIQRSVAQTSRPNSRARKIELIALP